MFRARQGDEEVRPFYFDRVLPQDREDWGHDLEKLQAQAHEEGYRAGFDTGLEKAAEALRRLEGLILGLEKTRTELYGRLEEEILALVFRIAEKVIHAEIRSNDSAKTAILAAGLRRLKESEKVVIRVSPFDHALIREVLPALKDQTGMTGRVILLEDPQVSEGGCVLESDQREVDARVEVTLQAIEEALRRP